MSKVNNGGPAFPLIGDGPNAPCFNQGMTLRDWFAGQALVMIPHMGCGMDLDPKDVGLCAYQFADAMLAAREVQP